MASAAAFFLMYGNILSMQLTLIDKLLADPRVSESITAEQAKMAKRIRKLCKTGI